MLTVSVCLLQATEEPVNAVDNMDQMLRPFNLVIPFTVQKGEITGINTNSKFIIYHYCFSSH